MIKKLIQQMLIVIVMISVAIPSTLAQNSVKVTGSVTDNEGEPMIGASVCVKNDKTRGVITDIDVKYAIQATIGETLVFSYVGYLTKDVKVSGTTLNVVLEEDNKLLDEVVVVGYGIQKKSNVTGAISQVKSEDMQNRTITNAQQALQGKTAGVQVVQSSGAPGSSPAVRVRGYSSNVDMAPLYVVDGVRLSSISGIDPNDIASMEVLKDAASAAIYGAQAGNGVVLITTKHGEKGDVGYGKITYDFQFAWESLKRMPKLLNSEQYIQYQMEGNIINSLTDVYQKGWDGLTNTNWSDIAFNTGHLQKHNLAFSGANDRSSYYLSLTYLNNNGIVRGDKDTYERLTAAINGDYNIKPWLKVGTNNQIEYYKSKSVATSGTYGNIIGSVMQLDPLTKPFYTADELTPKMRELLAQGKKLMTTSDGRYYGLSSFYDAEQTHPFVLRDRTTGKTTGFNVTGNIFGDLKPFSFLTLTSRFGYRLSSSHSPSYSHKFYATTTVSNNYIGISATTGNSIYYQWENFLNFNKTFADKHDVSAMIGMSFSKETVNSTNGGFAGNDTVGDAVQKDDPYGFGDLNYGLADATKTVGGGTSEATQTSYFGRAGYVYDGKYMAQFSLRADAYDLSKLPKSNRWGYFPAFSLGWEIARENFMESTRSWLDQLKLRFSWGKNGSIAALGGYQYSTDMADAGIYPFLGNAPYNYVYGKAPSFMGNDELEWETSRQIDYGIDARFLNSRLSLGIDYFDKKTEGLLISGVVPSLIVGGTASPLNAGNVSNSGWEVELGWRDHIGDFSYSVRGNIATLKNKVTYLHPSVSRISGYSFCNKIVSVFETGHPVWHMYGFQYSHIDPETGDAVMVDLNNDGQINDDDKTDIGCAIPDFTYGITLNAQYKGFDLTVFGTGASGNDVFMGLRMTDKLNSNVLKEEFYDGRWIAGSDNSHATAPAASSNLDEYLYSSAMVKDGSYFKIKQIQLGYTLPQSLVRKATLNNVRIYCSLEDFVTFTKYKGMDPEVTAGTGSSQGFDVGAYPISKKIVAGINITF